MPFIILFGRPVSILKRKRAIEENSPVEHLKQKSMERSSRKVSTISCRTTPTDLSLKCTSYFLHFSARATKLQIRVFTSSASFSFGLSLSSDIPKLRLPPNTPSSGDNKQPAPRTSQILDPLILHLPRTISWLLPIWNETLTPGCTWNITTCSCGCGSCVGQ